MIKKTNKDYIPFKPLSKKTKALLLSTIWQDDVFITPVFKGNQDVVLTYEVTMKYLKEPIFEYNQCVGLDLDYDYIDMNKEHIASGAVHHSIDKTEQQQDILDVCDAIQKKLRDTCVKTRTTKKEKTQREFVKKKIDFSRNKAALAKSGGYKCEPRIPLSDRDKAKLLKILARDDIIITEERDELMTKTYVKDLFNMELISYISDRDNCTETIKMDGRIVAEMDWHISMRITKAQQKIRDVTLLLDKRQEELGR